MPTLQELLAQKEEIDRQIAAAKRAEHASAIAQVRAIIEAHGLTADDVFGSGKKPRKSSGAVVAAKYRDPATGATWTGRGREPRWIQGQDRSKFAV